MRCGAPAVASIWVVCCENIFYCLHIYLNTFYKFVFSHLGTKKLTAIARINKRHNILRGIAFFTGQFYHLGPPDENRFYRLQPIKYVDKIVIWIPKYESYFNKLYPERKIPFRFAETFLYHIKLKHVQNSSIISTAFATRNF